jgi:hypothetical protein
MTPPNYLIRQVGITAPAKQTALFVCQHPIGVQTGTNSKAMGLRSVAARFSGEYCLTTQKNKKGNNNANQITFTQTT